MARETLPPPLPLSFRGELVPHLFRALRGGWSCAVVGVRGVGSSNLARFVCEPRVVASHMGLAGAERLFVHLEAPDAAVPARLFREISVGAVDAARAFNWPRAEQAAIRNLAARLPAGRDEAAAEALFALFAYLCRETGRQVVLACDEFDPVLLGQPPLALRALRRLRDENKYAVSFLLGTLREPRALAAQRADAAVSKFAELFDQHTFPLRPYTRQDALELLRRKTLVWLDELTPVEAEGLYRAAGGHAKLLVAALVALEGRRHLPWPEIARGLRDNPIVLEACAEIWHGLDPGEREALRLLALERGPDVLPEDLALVKLRGLAAGSPPVLFADSFDAFVRRQPALERDEAAAPRVWTSHLRDPLAKDSW